MSLQVLDHDPRVVLNHVHKHLARSRGGPSEAWRFPLVEAHAAAGGQEIDPNANRVTFVWDGREKPDAEVAVSSSCLRAGRPAPLARVPLGSGDSGFRAVTLIVPINEVHLYRFLVDGVPTLDPINPQRTLGDNGVERSRFFTWYCTQPLVLQRHERALLQRLTDHILPFRSGAGETFLRRHYMGLDKASRTREAPLAYRLDESVGVVSFVDGLLAREEAHRLVDYRLGLRQVRRVLELRHPGVPVQSVPRETFVSLYAEMASENVPGWNKDEYGSPSWFLKLLRRHTFTGAFSHPRYGGNASAVAWSYLEDRYRDPKGDTLFDWRHAVEKPWGRSPDYHG